MHPLRRVVYSQAGRGALIILGIGVFLVALGRGPWTSGVVSFSLIALAIFNARSLRGLLDHRRMISACLLVASAIFLLVPMVIGIVQVGSRAYGQLARVGLSQAWEALGLVSIVLTLLYVWARHWPERWGDAAFLIPGVLLFSIGRLLWVHLVQMTPYSDFADMWELTNVVAEEGLGEVRGGVFLERILPYLLPLRVLFGPEASSYSVPNVIVLTATSLLSYGLARLWFGVMAARFAFLFCQCSVEPWLAAEIPSHDIPGAFFTLVALGLFVLLHRALEVRRLRVAVFLSLGCGIALTLLDLQRATGTIVLVIGSVMVLLSLIVEQRWTVRDWSRILSVLLVCTIMPAFLFWAASQGLGHAGLAVPSERGSTKLWRTIGAHTDSWSEGTYEYYRENWSMYSRTTVEHAGGALEDPRDVDWGEIVLRKILTEASRAPQARLASFVRKAGALYELGRQQAYYLSGARLGEGERLRPDDLGIYAFVNNLWVTLFLVVFCVAFVVVWSRPVLPLIILLPMVYLAILSGALILIGEVQPRFMFQIWFIGPVYMGVLLAPRRVGTLT